MSDAEFRLTDGEKEQLLRLARKSLQVWLNEECSLQPDELEEYTTSPILQTVCGAFVTLHHAGELRGCIGTVNAEEPLYTTIAEMAISAASHDPRFPSVTPDELPNLDIEISVLSPMQQVENITEIIPGTHGLVVSQGYSRGLLLPQVASEHGWNRVEFLEHTARKAGLPPQAWRNATIQKFTAIVFGEKERTEK